MHHEFGYGGEQMDDTELTPFELATVAQFSDLLGDPSLWTEPSATLASDIAAAISRDRIELTATHSAAHSSARWRPASVALAAALATAAACLLAIVGIRQLTRVEPDSIAQVQATALHPEVSGSVAIRAVRSGIEVRLAVPGLPRREGMQFYQGWLKSCDGTLLVPFGSFHDLDEAEGWAGVSVIDFPILTVSREAASGPKDPLQGSSGEVVATAQVGPPCADG